MDTLRLTKIGMTSFAFNYFKVSHEYWSVPHLTKGHGQPGWGQKSKMSPEKSREALINCSLSALTTSV